MASEAPTKAAARTRGPRICQITFTAAAGTSGARPLSLAATMSNSSLMLTGYRPTVSASRSPAIRMASAINSPGTAERDIPSSAAPSEHSLDLRVGGRHVIEPLIEITRDRFQVLGELL